MKQGQIVTALVLSSILSVGGAIAVPEGVTASPAKVSVAKSNKSLKQNTKNNDLPTSVASAVKRDVASKNRIPIKNLEIIDYSPRIWRNGCLDLPTSNELCTQARVPGWQVILSDGNQNWTYHTNSTGRNIRLAKQVQSKLPNSVKNAVLQTASRRLELPVEELAIVQVDKRTWDNGCLNLARSGETCAQAVVPGWRLVVNAAEQRLVYHTNTTGSVVRLNQRESNIAGVRLPQRVSNVVLEAASNYTGLAISQLRIVNAEQVMTDGCLNLPRPGETCTEVGIRAWKVSVATGRETLVFHAHPNGGEVRLDNQQYSETPNVNLPRRLAERILVRASERSGLPVSQLRIVEVDRQQWPDSCLGIPDPLALCAATIVPGWRVTVSDGQQVLIYRVGESGTAIFDERASAIANNNGFQPVPIPRSELPRPLERGIVFRQIATGGIAGRTYETVLLDDGSLIRVRIGDANDSERSVHRIPLEQVRRFQQLLRQERDVFNNLDYPATRGGADYITYTLTSPRGSVRYSDISQNSLPEDLRLVVRAWTQMNRVY
ncbi:hypothetical protein [Scytonema sp. UIC 10036]|uniref:hypothetical protein n=1 Tax=Scytonema sp. UIC 10036 TaxID=2304196 RepID=UPI001FA9EE01|nr:hypothetical protein [Scytonema sp. UIC 10036]